ncbi:MAG: hypothetical protein HOV81_44340 [Kofleriaceae bacterium]|nr:hypothetical protein [Kofleriaceae bacterium]
MLCTALPLVACNADAPAVSSTEGATTCGSTSTELTPSAPAKYKPIGFLNNGCTAFLLDAEHVAAAAHCFVITETGSFQGDLRFYPGYHPSLVTQDPNGVPHAILDRAVVGTRVEPPGLFPGSDWGIAHVREWVNFEPGSLTEFAQLDADMSEGPGPVEHVAYNRGAFPVTGPDMMFDNSLCQLTPWWPNQTVHGMWTKQLGPLPAGERYGCNQRWMAGTIYSDCSLVSTQNDIIQHDCETWGGSSGAPLLRERSDGSTVVVGLTHGGAFDPPVKVPNGINCKEDKDPVCGDPATGFGCDLASNTCYQEMPFTMTPNPTCMPRTPGVGSSNGPAAIRFAHAPRFASNVAVARRPDGTAATAVFGIDADLDQVVMRQRLDDRPDYKSPFSYWQPLPRVSEHQLENIAACSAGDGRPMVFVTARQAGRNRILRTRFDAKLDAWRTWEPIEVPDLDPSVPASVADLDAAYDNDGNCHVYALDSAGTSIWSANMNDDWSRAPSWDPVIVKSPAASGTRLTALRDDDGFTWLATLDATGQMHAFARECNDDVNAWFHYTKIPSSYAVPSWRDLDLYWNSAGEARLVAIPTNADNVPLVQYQLPHRKCGAVNNPDGSPAIPEKDASIPAKLWAPGSTMVVRPQLRTITASRWLEDQPGTVSPTIFSTDAQGNVYFISNTAGYGWTFEWQSFYHEVVSFP